MGFLILLRVGPLGQATMKAAPRIKNEGHFLPRCEKVLLAARTSKTTPWIEHSQGV
jgi:hypothetical protein